MPREYGNDPQLLEQSKQYSRDTVRAYPEVGVILEQLGLQYLHQLDPDKVYNLDTRTGVVTTLDAEQSAQPAQVGAAGIDFGFGTPTAMIRSAGSDIIGQGRTVVTCPFAGQLAEVRGFMASTVSRDPRGGIRNGQLVQDNFLTSVAEVDFRILMASGGARNRINRTVMETTHTGSCGDDLRIANLVSTWPPLRVDMVIDDTGSMSNELAGLKSALVGFINAQGSDPAQAQRGVSYELISFKDAPALRLANTEDTGAAIAAVQSLFPGGGGDCPEDAIGGLSLALGRMGADESAEGAIVLVTDASPRGGSVDGVIAGAQAAGIKVHVMLSGDCVAAAAAAKTAAQSDGTVSAQSVEAAAESARTVFKRIADETGGLYFYRPSGTAQDYAEILAEIFRTAHSGGDREPPVVTVTASPGELWPANHRMIPIEVTVSAVDGHDPAPVVVLEGVTSSEPDDGSGDGDTSNDIQIGADGSIKLRAERSGEGPGRTYTITYRATDASGNAGYGSAEVIVPHDGR